MTTSVGRNTSYVTKGNPLPNSVVIISSAAINIDAVPAISLKDFVG
jgi:hypothetical protein